MFSVLPTALRFLLGSFLWSNQPDTAPTPLRFQLRHEHAAVTNSSSIVFSNVSPFFTSETYGVHTRIIEAHRPSSFAAFTSARSRSIKQMQTEPLAWDPVHVVGPNVEKRETLLQLAKMTFNSYYEPGGKEWYDLNGWSANVPFGWEPDADGFRGHVFVSEDNSTVVISVKGTSAGWIAGGGGPTTKKDKLNDNLLFSCCCARVGPTWYPVCDCYSGHNRCDQTCLEQSLIEDDLFYPVGMNLYNNVSFMYPEANIWMIGHSLGGSLASLVGVTFGAPVVAFEAPGEKMAAARLHLPSPPSTQHITHVHHTADPIPMGTCNGVSSICAIGGYAMESRCHLGKVAIYDTVTRFGWSVDIRNHPIKVVIETVLNEDWDPAQGREVPLIEEEKDCVDCFNWEYGEYQNGSLVGG